MVGSFLRKKGDLTSPHPCAVSLSQPLFGEVARVIGLFTQILRKNLPSFQNPGSSASTFFAGLSFFSFSFCSLEIRRRSPRLDYYRPLQLELPLPGLRPLFLPPRTRSPQTCPLFELPIARRATAGRRPLFSCCHTSVRIRAPLL